MAKLTADLARTAHARRLHWAGYLLGFALGGFFDGILLHQVLQWHHLLSGLEGPAFRDLRVQVLADGLFHLLMYAVALLGLALLWRERAAFSRAGAGRRVLGNLLIGFGAWHVVDAVLSHWLIGLHRIRMDSAYPLLWDLAWVVVFGVVAILVGLRQRRRSEVQPPTTPRRRTGATPLLLAGTTLLAGAAAALPPRGAGTVLVVFRPGVTTEQMFAGFAAVGGGIVWADPSGAVWAIELADGREAGALYRHGALLVSNSAIALGCLSWSRS